MSCAKVSRLISIQFCYSRLICGFAHFTPEAVFQTICLQDNSISTHDPDLLESLLFSQLTYYNEACGLVSTYIKSSWSFSRIDLCTRSIIVSAVCEMMHNKALSRATIVNEYVGIASDFRVQIGFVNAILDKIGQYLNLNI